MSEAASGRASGRWPSWAGAVAAILVGVVALTARMFLVEVVRVTDAGMQPAVLRGDVLLVWKPAEVAVGDVVLFASEGVVHARRVVAGPGEEVALDDGRLQVDGVRRTGEEVRESTVPTRACGAREARLRPEAHGETTVWVEAWGEAEPEVVPDGHWYLLGDYRREASDSRVWGPFSDGDLVGSAAVVLWSVDPCTGRLRWGRTLLAASRW